MNLEKTLIFALAIVGLWRVVVIFTTNPRVILKGKVPGKLVIMGISGLIFAGIYLWGSGFGTTQIIGAVMFFCCTMLYVPVKSGFTQDGMSFNGTIINYNKIQYYTFEEIKGTDEVRIRTTCTRKDMTLIFSKEEGELARAYFVKNEIPDFEGYKMSQREKSTKE